MAPSTDVAHASRPLRATSLDRAASIDVVAGVEVVPFRTRRWCGECVGLPHPWKGAAGWPPLRVTPAVRKQQREVGVSDRA